MSANRRAEAIARLRSFVRFVEQEDEKMVEQVLQLSRSRRLFAPLAASVTGGRGLPRPLFVLALSIAVGLLMVVNLSLPARLLRLEQPRSRRDRAAASALGAVLSAVVTAPFYLLSRVGLLLVGSSVLAGPGYALLPAGGLLPGGRGGPGRPVRLSGAPHRAAHHPRHVSAPRRP